MSERIFKALEERDAHAEVKRFLKEALIYEMENLEYEKPHYKDPYRKLVDSHSAAWSDSDED